MIPENKDVRRKARAAGIPLWKVAATLGVSEPTLTRWLRFPLTQEKEDRILAVIDQLEREVG